MKAKVFADMPRNTEELKAAIVSEASRIPQEMVDSAVTHLQTVRLPMVLERGGRHLEHLLWRDSDVAKRRMHVSFAI